MMQSSLDKQKSFYDCKKLEIKSSRAKCETHHSGYTEPCQECFWIPDLPMCPSGSSFWGFKKL